MRSRISLFILIGLFLFIIDYRFSYDEDLNQIIIPDDEILGLIDTVLELELNLADCRQSAAAVFRRDFASSILLKSKIRAMLGMARLERMLSPARTTINSSSVKPLEPDMFTILKIHNYIQCLCMFLHLCTGQL